MTVQIIACFQLIPVLIVAILFVYLRKRRGNVHDRIGYFLLQIIQTGLAVSSLAYGLELVSAELNQKLTYIFFRYLGSYMMMMGSLFFAFWYTGRRQWLTWRLAFVIGLPAWLSLVLIAVKSLRHLYYMDIWLVHGLSVPQIAHTVGPFYYLIMGYCLCVMFTTLYMLVSSQLTSARIYGPGIALATGAYFVTVMGYLLYLGGFKPLGFLNMTYYFSTISAITLTIVAVRYDVLMVRPLGYEVMIRDLPIGVVLFDRNLNIVDINTMARRMLSLDDREPILGRPLSGIPRQEQSILDFIAMRKAGVMETNVDGIDILCSLADIHDHLQGIAGMSLLLQDITERKRTETAMRESEEKHRLLIEKLPLAVFVDADGKIDYVNLAFVNLFHASSPDEVIGMRLIDFVSPTLFDTIEKRRRIMTKEKRNLPPLELNLRCLDGTFITVVYTPIPIIFEGQPAILSALYDITDRKRSEIELQKACKLLEIQGRQIEDLQAQREEKAVRP